MTTEGSGDHISATVSGSVGGSMAVGKNITQTHQVGAPAQVTEEERAELANKFVSVQEQIQAEAPPEKVGAALERVAELEEALSAPEPDLDAMSGVSAWFRKNLPSLAGAVTSVVVHPVVGKIVSAAGEAVASEFERRFKSR